MFLNLYAKHLAPLGIILPLTGRYQRFNGDASVPGKGEILIWQP